MKGESYSLQCPFFFFSMGSHVCVLFRALFGVAAPLLIFFFLPITLLPLCLSLLCETLCFTHLPNKVRLQFFTFLFCLFVRAFFSATQILLFHQCTRV